MRAMLNWAYLNTLPEVENRFGVKLNDDEKVVFAEKLSLLGDHKGQMLGSESPFTMTNQRIIVDNGAGIWTVELEKEATDFVRVDYGKWIFKGTYFALPLNKEVVFDDGKRSLTGYQFYFGKELIPKMTAIVEALK